MKNQSRLRTGEDALEELVLFLPVQGETPVAGLWLSCLPPCCRRVTTKLVRPHRRRSIGERARGRVRVARPFGRSAADLGSGTDGAGVHIGFSEHEEDR